MIKPIHVLEEKNRMYTVHFVKEAHQPITLEPPQDSHIQVCSNIPNNGFYLCYVDNQLTLKHTHSSLSLAVDFNSADIQNRIKANTARLDLVKAIEGKSKQALHVLDMTAGLGQDSFCIAARGHRVTAIESNPYVFLLLLDGLKRAVAEPKLAQIANQIQLNFANSGAASGNLLSSGYDVIYLDPMFPERAKSAKVKKNRQLLHELVGIDDHNDQSLWRRAKALQPKKIVVKRPRLGESLSVEKPGSQVIGKSSRFDIYALP